MTFIKLIVFAFVFLVGLLAGADWKPMQPNKIISSQRSSETINKKISIPEIVANQIKSGDLTCPNSDSLTYESCLLYQGALGTWQRLGLPEICPDVVDDSYQPPFPFPKEGRSLLPADALRAPTVTCFSYLYAIQVASATPVLVSTSNRAFRIISGKPFFEPASDPNLCIEARHGICGNQAALGVALFELAGFKSRPVEFYYYDEQRLSHIITEVMIDGDWRLVDTTYGAYWISSIPGKPFNLKASDDLLNQGMTWARRGTKLLNNSAILPYGIFNEIGRPNYFGYLNPGASVLRGGKGEIFLQLKDKKGVEKLINLPNYIGDNKTDGENAGISFKLDAPPGKYSVTIRISGSAIDEKGPVAICIDKTCTEFSEEKKVYQITAINPGRLYLNSEMDVSYIVITSIEWELVD